MNQNKKSEPVSKSSGKTTSTMSTTKATIFVVIALVVGFVGGIKFADNANQKLTVNAISNTPTNMAMPQMGMPGSMSGMSPGQVNIDKQQAISKMEEMLKADSSNVQLLVHLGNLYYDTQNPQKAVEAYERALAIDRKNPDVLTDCGVMYRALKKYDKALACFKEATQISPKHFQSWYNMGIVYREDLKQYQKAIDTWNQLLVNIPDSENAAQVKEDIAKTKALF